MAYLSYASAMPRGSPATMAATTSPSSIGFTLVRSTPAGQRDRHNALIATGQVRWDVSDRGASASAGGRFAKGGLVRRLQTTVRRLTWFKASYQHVRADL